MQKYSKDFTLIELLVVVGIIAILASLLLPALKKAKTTAVRALCLGERRQNYLAVSSFALDHDDLMPYTINGWASGKREYSGISGGHHAAILFTQHTYYISDLNPIGTMIAKGYINNPSILFCPTFYKDLRPKSQAGNIYINSYCDLPQNRANWNRMKDWNNNVMPRGQIFGITHYFVRYGHWMRNPAKLRFYGEEWKRYETSPMILSCGNYRFDGVSEWRPKSQSHLHKGLNGSFFDGSGRWIDEREIDPTGTRRATYGDEHMVNDSASYPPHGLQKWAQKTLTLTY